MHQEGHGKDPRPLPARGGSRKWSLGSWRTANSTAGLHQPEQSQRLPVGNAASEQWRMSRRDGALARHPADADLDQDPIQDVALCADDGGDQLPAFVGVPPGEGDRSLSVDQSSDVSGSHRRQSLLTALVHCPRPFPAGGSGWWRRRDSWSASSETGWTMPSPRSLDRGRGVLSEASSPRILVPAQLPSAQPVYESLQGRPEVGLQGRPEVGPLPTPRRYLAPPSPARQASPM